MRDLKEQTLDGGIHFLESISSRNIVSSSNDFDLQQRSNLVDLDRHLHAHWNLGRNIVLGWCSHNDDVLLLVVPHYAMAEYASAAQPGQQDNMIPAESQEFIKGLLSGSRSFTHRQIHNAAQLLGSEPIVVRLRQPLSNSQSESLVIDRLVKRYSINFVPGRAVALFDIVGFSLLSPFEQMTQLNSLSYSLNSAHSKMVGSRMNINFARSSTGDGFYIWNRDYGIEANTNLYHFMHLVLADNAIARHKAQEITAQELKQHGKHKRSKTVPLLRVGFHVGSCYEFHQAEGLNPTTYCDIVGDVTIELARMIERALPGQILVGEFQAELLESDDGEAKTVQIDSIEFVNKAQENLSRLNGLVLSGEAIESIKCYLTGQPRPDGTFSIRKLVIQDKHGLTRNAFNAKINIYRREADPILLGIEDRVLNEKSLA